MTSKLAGGQKERGDVSNGKREYGGSVKAERGRIGAWIASRDAKSEWGLAERGTGAETDRTKQIPKRKVGGRGQG